MNNKIALVWVSLLVLAMLKWWLHFSLWDARETLAHTTRTLPFNHQLAAQDLQDFPANDTFIGKYLLTAKNKSASIALSEIGLQPAIKISPDSLLGIFSLKEDELPSADVLDAGALIYVFSRDTLMAKTARLTDSPKAQVLASQSKPVAQESLLFRVAAIHRPSKESPGTWLWVTFPAVKSKEVAILAASKKVILKAPD